MELKREAPISIYPPIIKYNTRDIDRIWDKLPDAGISDEPANLYVHIPFCAQRCDFCYFSSFTAGDTVVRKYADALKKEIEMISGIKVVRDRRFHTLYFGGGTPTYMKTEYLTGIIQALKENFLIENDCEFCVEVRPGREATEEKLQALYEHGVTRISMGAQSFDQDVLDLNGRKHKLEDFFKVYERTRQVGFSNINIDVMSGMIGDTEKSWRKTTDTVISLAPENITIYKMQVYKSSELYKKIVESGRINALIDDETEIERTRYFYKRMEQAGYIMSATPYTFTKSKTHDHLYRMSRTSGSELLGMGLSANSFINRTAYQNTNNIDEYTERISQGKLPIKSAYRLTEEEEIKRALIFGLKTGRINRQHFKERYGKDPVDEQRSGFERLLEDGLVEISTDEIRFAGEAYLYADDIVRKYILSDKERQMEKLLVLHKNVKLKI